MNEQNLKRFNKLFPWFAGLSGDLLFWVAIDTLLALAIFPMGIRVFYPYKNSKLTLDF